MRDDEREATINLALHQVMEDLDGRPLNPTIVLAYWLVMTHMLADTYGICEDTLSRLYPVAHALKIKTVSASTFLN